jgi:putative peptidoglycan lipid II flippase
MGAIARLLFNSLLSIISQNLALIISIGIGIIVYFAIIYFMKIDDIDIIASNVRKRLRIRRRTVET